MKFYLFTLFFGLYYTGLSQPKQDILVGTNIDLIKSDNDGYFERAQIGLEGNYFFNQFFTGTAGIEFWTGDQVSAVIGTRWYVIPDAFVRLRGLIGADDVSLGGGWAKPMTETLRFEAMTDYYFEGNFTIRAGFAYIIKPK